MSVARVWRYRNLFITIIIIIITIKVEVCNQIASGYLRGTTYLRMPLSGMIPVVTLFVKGVEAVCRQQSWPCILMQRS